MSQDGTGVAIAPPVAPAVAEQPAAPVAPAAPEAAVEKPLTEGHGHQNARARAAQRAKRMQERQQNDRAVAEAAREKALGQPRVEAGKPEGGQFTKGAEAQDPAASLAAPEPGSAEATTSGATQAPASPAPSTPTEPTGAKAPAGMVDVPLPDGHPLRDRGRTFIRVAQEFEADVRNGINSTMRLKDAEAERDRLAKDNALLEARRQALSGDLPNPERDPALKVLLEQVRATKWGDKTGDQMAEILIAAFQASEKVALRNAEDQATQSFEDERVAGRVLNEITTQASQVFGIWAQAGELWRVPQLVKQYYAAVDARNTRDGVVSPPTMKEFFDWVRPAYRADPRVQAAIEGIRKQDADKERERIRKEVEAEYERKQQEAAAQAAQRRAGIPPTSRALSPAPTSGTPTQTPPAPRTPQAPGSHHKSARNRAAEIAAKYLRTP